MGHFISADISALETGISRAGVGCCADAGFHRHSSSRQPHAKALGMVNHTGIRKTARTKEITQVTCA